VVAKEDRNLLLREAELIGEAAGEHWVHLYVIEVRKITQSLQFGSRRLENFSQCFRHCPIYRLASILSSYLGFLTFNRFPQRSKEVTGIVVEIILKRYVKRMIILVD
jgi:hypothetical protein